MQFHEITDNAEHVFGLLLVAGAAFGEVTTNIFFNAGVAVIGCNKLANLDYREVTKGLHVHVGELTGQDIAKEVKLGLMSVHGPGTLLFKKVEETVDKGIVVFQPWIQLAFQC